MPLVRAAVLCLWALFTAEVFAAPAPPEQLHALILAEQQIDKVAATGWPDLSLAAFDAREARDRATLDKLHAIPRGSVAGDDRTLYDLLEWLLNRRLESFRLRLYLTPFSDYGDVLLSVPEFLATASPRQAQSIPALLNQVIALMREAIRARMLPARELVRPAVEHCPAARYSNYCEVLTKEYYPACPESRSLALWPNGAEVYRELARTYTTTDLDPKEIHELGLKEVARIRAAMLTVIARTGFKGSLDEFLAYARTDPRFYYTNGDDLLAAYRAALARIQPFLPKVVSRIPHRPLAVEAYEGPAAAVWHAPHADKSATILVATADPSIHPRFEILALMLHEGVPGHELQHAVADELREVHSDALAMFERTAGQNSAYAEGWALYSEGLGREMGLFGDPYDEFGALRMELTRAVRVVIDTGIHEYGWSVDRAKQYFISQTGKPAAEVDGEVSRTLGPGGQLAYKSGQLRIQRMRDETSRALGDRFDLRAFDDAILAWGPLPLDILERKLNECLVAPECRATLAR